MSIHEHFVGPMGGILMSLIAFSIVFLVILGLMLVMFATKKLAQGVDAAAKAKSAAQPDASAPAAKAVAVAPAPAASIGAPTEDGELVAVIAAAIAAACGRAVAVTGIRPVLPAGGALASSWKMAGRMEQLEG